jgi:hypothetical protein
MSRRSARLVWTDGLLSGRCRLVEQYGGFFEFLTLIKIFSRNTTKYSVRDKTRL